jgi:hypothetical protein
MSFSDRIKHLRGLLETTKLSAFYASDLASLLQVQTDKARLLGEEEIDRLIAKAEAHAEAKRQLLADSHS